jgi:hypothetical protein
MTGFYTRDELIELIKCRDDMLYFMDNYMMIDHPVMGKTWIIPNTYQVDIVNAHISNDRVVASAPRQSGKTTAIACIALHTALFNKYSVNIIASPSSYMSKSALEKVAFAYDCLPDYFKSLAAITSIKKKSIRFSNHSSIDATISTNLCRGRSVTTLLLDDIDFAKDKNVWGFMPTIISGKCVVVSTPNTNEKLSNTQWKRVGDSAPLSIEKTLGLSIA